jgi:hypothetical protein
MRRHLASCLIVLVLPALVRADQSKPATVPFELLVTKHMAIKVKINGHGPFRVIFDTGAPVSLVNTRVAKVAGLLPKDTKPSRGFGFLAAGQGKMKTLEVGGLKAKDVPIIIMDHPTVEAINQVLGPVEGIIGFPFFARYRMTLDYQAQQMTFVPNSYEPGDVMSGMMKALLSADKPPPKVLASAGLWGLAVAKERGDEQPGVVVEAVLAGSPAARAGLRKGDRLLTLDGRWTDSVADCYQAVGAVKPGTDVAVSFKRDGKDKELTVKPAAGL